MPTVKIAPQLGIRFRGPLPLISGLDPAKYSGCSRDVGSESYLSKISLSLCEPVKFTDRFVDGLGRL